MERGDLLVEPLVVQCAQVSYLQHSDNNSLFFDIGWGTEGLQCSAKTSPFVPSGNIWVDTLSSALS